MVPLRLTVEGHEGDVGEQCFLERWLFWLLVQDDILAIGVEDSPLGVSSRRVLVDDGWGW